MSYWSLTSLVHFWPLPVFNPDYAYDMLALEPKPGLFCYYCCCHCYHNYLFLLFFGLFFQRSFQVRPGPHLKICTLGDSVSVLTAIFQLDLD